MKKANTSWGKSAEWYDEMLKSSDTYQRKLILPNLTRLLNFKKGEIVLDLACGQGFFAKEFVKGGAKVIAVDVSKELIALANKDAKNVEFHTTNADNISFLKNNSVDKVVIVLALQNIENVSGVFKECARVLRQKGELYIVLNHPAFRVPKQSDWGWDSEKQVQYRRIDAYISESKVKIQMHPGDDPKDTTLSFHRPLQFYMKALHKAGFAVSQLEEWTSHKKSEAGPRAKAEDTARKEIPLFLFLKAITYEEKP